MSTPKISVVIPSLNVAPYIAECLESAVNQTLKDIEIICVDAGSTDGTLDVLQEYAQRDNRVKVLHSDKKSYGYQVNMGFDVSQGEYFAILESDDIIRPRMYEDLYALAKKHEVDLIKADHEIFLGKGDNRTYSYQSICVPKYYNKVLDPSQQIQIFNAKLHTWAGIYNMQFLRRNNIRHNETPGASYQDNGFWFQTFAWAERVYFVNKAYYLLRRDNPNSSVKSTGKVYCIFDEYAFIEEKLRADAARTARFIAMFHKKKFDNCRFHYSRIADAYKLDFLRRMSQEYNAAKQELDSSLFVNNGYQEICQIMEQPELYYLLHSDVNEDLLPAELKVVLLEYKLQSANAEIQELRNSTSMKIGRIMTFLPRKLRNAVIYWRENGFVGTVLHAFEKLGLKKGQ